MPLLKVALTGGIACGKSVVAEYFKKKGCYLQEADKVAHRLMEPGKPVWKAIVDHFGQDILNPDKTINRQRLGHIVFNCPEERNFLNQLIHPLVLKKKKETVRRLEKAGKVKIFVSEAALTVEAGLTSFFDKIVVVSCPEEIQVRRLMARSNLSRKEALQRVRSQLPLKEKIKQADYVIDASKTITETLAQAEKVYQSLLRDYRQLARKRSRFQAGR